MGTVAMHDYRVCFASGGVAPLPDQKRTKGKARSQANCARYSAASIRDDQASEGVEIHPALPKAPGALDRVGIIT
jgi:hypothetical protein